MVYFFFRWFSVIIKRNYIISGFYVVFFEIVYIKGKIILFCNCNILGEKVLLLEFKNYFY